MAVNKCPTIQAMFFTLTMDIDRDVFAWYCLVAAKARLMGARPAASRVCDMVNFHFYKEVATRHIQRDCVTRLESHESGIVVKGLV